VFDVDEDGKPEAVLEWMARGGNMAPFDQLYQFRNDSLFPVLGTKGTHIRLKGQSKFISSEEVWLNFDPRCCPIKMAVYTYQYSSGTVELIGTDTVSKLDYQR
jgi:hypothetical protein